MYPAILLYMLMVALVPHGASDWGIWRGSEETVPAAHTFAFSDDVIKQQIDKNIISDEQKGLYKLQECYGKQSVNYVVREDGSIHDTIPTLATTSADITVYITRPSQSELVNYFSYPPSITFSSKGLAVGMTKTASKALVWLNESGSSFNWQLHPSHPRVSNKQLCIKATEQSTKPSLLYEDLKKFKPFEESTVLGKYYLTNRNDITNKQKSSGSSGSSSDKRDNNIVVYPFSSYLIVTSNVYLLSDGIGVRKCGYIQSHEGCDTKFPFLGRNFNKYCKNILNKEIVAAFKGANTAVRNNVPLAALWDWYLDGPRTDVGEGDNKTYSRIGTVFETYCKQKVKPHKRTAKNNFTDYSAEYVSMPDAKYLTGLAPSIPVYDRVFVATTVWDHNYHHLTVDMLTRMIRYLPFLMKNPDVKIQIRRTEMQFNVKNIITTGINLRKQYWTFLGISEDRFVDGPMFARVAYIPRHHSCNHYFQVGVDLHLLVTHLKAKANSKVYTDKAAEILASYLQFQPENSRKKPIMALIHRLCYSTKQCLKSWREFENDLFIRQFKAFHDEFSSKYNLIILKSDDKKLSQCIACQINLFSKVDVVVATHGAGITNIMYMKPETVLVEIIGKFDGRVLPVCGYHGPLASLFGIHHTIYYYDWMSSPKDHKELDFKALVKQTKDFLSFLKK